MFLFFLAPLAFAIGSTGPDWSAVMPLHSGRFVILEHDHPFLHWDFMLECGGTLWTWRLSAPPSPANAVDAERIADHRIEYLDYEGPVSRDRGTVTRWDTGTYQQQDGTVDRFQLSGEKLQGVLTIREGVAKLEDSSL